MKRKAGRPKKPPKFKDLLENIIPAADIFEEDELNTYQGLVQIYLKDFEESQLTANDMDDIMSIAMNRVLELRLLKNSKGNPEMQMDASSSIEKLRKQTEKLKENLVSRRKDRIDPKKYDGFSIVDLAVAFDLDRKRELLEKAADFKVEEDGVNGSDMLVGNKDDADADVIETD